MLSVEVGSKGFRYREFITLPRAFTPLPTNEDEVRYLAVKVFAQ
jgi:hypothetical protein